MRNKWRDTIRSFPTHIVTVGGLVESAEGKILMVKHPVRGWKMPGGQVEIGETISEAFKREIKEETGIDIEAGNAISGKLTISEGSLEVS